jgi:flagellar assembly factor FliW
MQIHTTNESLQPAAEKAEVTIPSGLIGLSHLTSFQIIADPDISPFVVLRHQGEEEMDFLAVDPSKVLKEYNLEVSDADAEELGISLSGNSPLILNVAIIQSTEPPKITANLMAPILFNRETGMGRQVLLENSSSYSAEHQLDITTL